MARWPASRWRRASPASVNAERARVLRRVRAAVLIAALAGIAAILAAYRPSILPPLHQRDIQFATAKTQVLVDTRPSNLLSTEGALTAGQTAVSYALYLESDAVRSAIGRAVGIGNQAITASGPFTLLLDRSNPAPPAAPVLPFAGGVDKRYRLVVDVDGASPVLTLYSQAPTPAAANAIVTAARDLLAQHVSDQERSGLVDRGFTPILIPLGQTPAAIVDPHAQVELMALAAALVLLAGGGVLAYKSRRRRAADRRSVRSPAVIDDLVQKSDDWPHTKRVVPWAMAVFLAMLFLMPFDQISLPGGSLTGSPDRVLLIVIGLLWCATLAVGNRSARSPTRLTSIHVIGLLFFALCCASVAVNGHALANLTELQPVLKKLVLLASFLVFLWIAACVIRPGEAARYGVLIVILAVIAALGAIVEYRLHYNVFYAGWGKVFSVTLPPQFDMKDDIGRLTVVGPTSQPLELAALISMAIPFAIVGMLDAGGRRRVLYALAVAVLVAGGLATGRKTAVVAPIVGVAVLCAYRPRAMWRGLKLAAIPLAVVTHFAAPGAIGAALHWLNPATATTVHTTSDRLARYDAVRPDVFSHLLLGRGFQSYDPHKYRVLDNEFLGILIGVGVIGLLAYALLYLAIFRSAHRVISGVNPRRASLALASASAVTIALVANALFDTLSFPHVPYLVFFIAAMVIALDKPSTATSSVAGPGLPRRQYGEPSDNSPAARAPEHVPSSGRRDRVEHTTVRS